MLTSLGRRLIEFTVVLAILAGLCLLLAPVFSTKPSPSAKRVWEPLYASELPPGYSNFLPHWFEQDAGIMIYKRPPAERNDGSGSA